jgi:hypothetical protein
LYRTGIAPKLYGFSLASHAGYDNSRFLVAPDWYSNDYYRVLEFVHNYDSSCT